MPQIILKLRSLIALLAAVFAAGAKAGPAALDKAQAYLNAAIAALMRLLGIS